MEEIVLVLNRMGENYKIIDNEVKVKLSWILGDLSIKTDLSKNTPDFFYRQTIDLLIGFFMIIFSILYISEGSYTMASLTLAFGLLSFTVCILKEIRVSAIKAELLRALGTLESTYNKPVNTDSQ